MVYPNNSCLLFCDWMLNVSWQVLTPTRLSLIQTIYTAALNGTSVTQQQYNNFTQVTAWRYPYYLVWKENNFPFEQTISTITLNSEYVSIYKDFDYKKN